jgi:ribosome biogenesis GTPase
MREVGLANSEVGVKATFGEIEDFAPQCKFRDCTHVHESGCAVREAVESGMLDEDRYENYIRLKKESEHYEMTDYEIRGKEKKFGKYVKKSLKRMKEFE